jgi:lysophospholipase L1-like esterase
MNKVDIAIVFYGTNDLAYSSKIGKAGSMDVSTIRGSINYSVKKLLSAYPKLQIMFVTPMWRGGENVKGNSDLYVNNGISLKMINNGIIAGAAENNIPVLDMQKCGINKSNYTTYLYDGLHPNDGAGGELIGNSISAALLSIR